MFGVLVASVSLLHNNDADSDHNIHAAYIHVIADALKSLFAILGFLVAKIWNLPFFNAIVVILSSMVIIKCLKDLVSFLLDIETSQKDENYCIRHRYHHHSTD